MLITNEIFSVCPVTTHIDLKEVSKKISKHIIIQKIKKLLINGLENINEKNLKFVCLV